MDTLAARQQMVDQQIRTWEVLDPRVLDAIASVPREAFVAAAYRELAFADAPLPIGCGQLMLAPKVQGRILQALEINPADVALEELCLGVQVVRDAVVGGGEQRVEHAHGVASLD